MLCVGLVNGVGVITSGAATACIKISCLSSVKLGVKSYSVSVKVWGQVLKVNHHAGWEVFFHCEQAEWLSTGH